jgi:Glycosyl hydrolase family 47
MSGHVAGSSRQGTTPAGSDLRTVVGLSLWVLMLFLLTVSNNLMSTESDQGHVPSLTAVDVDGLDGLRPHRIELPSFSTSPNASTGAATSANGRGRDRRTPSSLLPASSSSSTVITNSTLVLLRDQARQVFLHSYDSYMKFGFPHDEVCPITCKPRIYNQRSRGDLDDVLGGYMLSLIDSLDTLLILGEHVRFKNALKKIKQGRLNFRRNVEVSVFESNIRVLGGLLSAHQLAKLMMPLDVYDGESLLALAVDLGDRLMPAFSTKTGIPVHRINLRKGWIANERSTTCTAAGGSFLLEMGLLSRLSGNPKYEVAAYKALKSLWERRSRLNLVGSLIDVQTGKWITSHSGIGAGIDSFFETMIKSSILLGNPELMSWFEEAYASVQYHSFFHGVNIEIDMHQGRAQPFSYTISALQAFWPALQILAGLVGDAVQTFDHLLDVWNIHGALPDIYNLATKDMLHYARDYPLRPEMIESAYHLQSATKDSRYLSFGRDALFAIQNKSRTECGYAAVADVGTGRLDDRMDSFFLAETTKYLFLLFDDVSVIGHETNDTVNLSHVYKVIIPLCAVCAVCLYWCAWTLRPLSLL